MKKLTILIVSLIILSSIAIAQDREEEALQLIKDAKEAFRNGDIDRARKNLEKAWETAPDSEQVRTELKEIKIKIDNWKENQGTPQETQEEALTNKGYEYLEADNYERAKELFENALEYNPDYQRAQEGLNEAENQIDLHKIKGDGPNWDVIGIILAIAMAIAGWFITRRKKGKTSNLMKEIDNAYSSFRMNARRCEAELYRLKDIIAEQLKNGKIDESAFAILDKRIDDYMKEVREQILAEKFGKIPEELKKDLKIMLKDNEISKEEYDRFEKHMEKEDLGESEKKDLKKFVKDIKDKSK